MSLFAAHLARLEARREEILELQYQARLLRLKLSLQLAFSSDQPRVPAGHPDGGQWTGQNQQSVPRSPL